MAKVKRLLLGERSNRKPGSGSESKILHGSTRTRLDGLYPGWEDAFTVRNVWKDKADERDGQDRIAHIIKVTNPDVIVMLGIQVSLLMDVPYETEWLDTVFAWGVPAIKFPHPSGRSRVWNDPEFTAQAKKVLAQAAEAPLDDLIPAGTPVSKPLPDESPDTRPDCDVVTKFLSSYGEWRATCACGWECVSHGKETPAPPEFSAQVDFHLSRNPS